MKAEIITVGDELLSGLTLNGNAAFIGQRLTGSGYELRWVSTVGDDAEDIFDALGRAQDRADVVIMTGGLGPTHDDITKKVVARYFESEMVFDQRVYAWLEERFRQWGREVSPSNRAQAEIPAKAEVLRNTAGTAPGLLFRAGRKRVFVLPGVPEEMRRLMEEEVMPRLGNAAGAGAVRTRMLRTVGIPESTLYERLQPEIERFSDVRIAFLPKARGVAVRLTASGPGPEEAENRLREASESIVERAGRFFLGEGDLRIEEVVADLLEKKGFGIAVAESCTGGLVCDMLTNVPGISRRLERGVVAYSNEAKTDLLRVPAASIEEHGAVSPETARAMAEGVRCISGTHIGLATSGIAGPAGGTPSKPVGLVYIAYADARGAVVERHMFPKDRRWNKVRTAVTALDLVRRVILGYTSIKA